MLKNICIKLPCIKKWVIYCHGLKNGESKYHKDSTGNILYNGEKSVQNSTKKITLAIMMCFTVSVLFIELYIWQIYIKTNAFLTNNLLNSVKGAKVISIC